eukprot:TRINITY_DN11464_c0_g1_i1.p1 TRINITY_DN11464_c0_g1~~TRINITY_DN11464_c0_g1_i1.p1  ORF type:complete len:959 (+),score=186.45 TRINITY_DN11464_c0_g1_i1:284-2878(+)
MDDGDILGEGSFSICRRGLDLISGEVVAIKTFKDSSGDTDCKIIQLQKFRKQVGILTEMAQPFDPPKDPSLWCEQLMTTRAEDLFMKLVDYSKNEKATPGPDSADGVLYLITELASYSLDDYLYEHQETERPLTTRAVQELCRACVLVVAGLHAKGFCHLDLKPENLMLFNSRLKPIDVDGCVRTGAQVVLGDASVSFSPAFCAPEWARWMTSELENEHIDIWPSLDAWSMGMTISQLITLDVILEGKYAEFAGTNARTEFLTWLGFVEEPPIPLDVQSFDQGFVEVVLALLEVDHRQRLSLARCMALPFIKNSEGQDNRVALEEEDLAEILSWGERGLLRPDGMDQREDSSTDLPLLQAVAWLPKSSCAGEDPAGWARYDIWLTERGDICYFSMVEGKRLVYVACQALFKSQVLEDFRGPRGSGVEIRISGGNVVRLGFDRQQVMSQWLDALRLIAEKGPKSSKKKMTPFIKCVSKISKQPSLRLTCANRRLPLPADSRRDYDPVFRAVLWKLKTGACRTEMRQDLASPWVAREFWISVNFSLVYMSHKEERELVFLSPADMEGASVVRIPCSKSAMPWSFEIRVPPPGMGVEFEPVVFAAVSRQARERWIQEFSLQRVQRSSRIQEVRRSWLKKLPDGGAAILAAAAKGDYKQLVDLHEQAVAGVSPFDNKKRRSCPEPEAEPFRYSEAPTSNGGGAPVVGFDFEEREPPPWSPAGNDNFRSLAAELDSAYEMDDGVEDGVAVSFNLPSVAFEGANARKEEETAIDERSPCMQDRIVSDDPLPFAQDHDRIVSDDQMHERAVSDDQKGFDALGLEEIVVENAPIATSQNDLTQAVPKKKPKKRMTGKAETKAKAKAKPKKKI